MNDSAPICKAGVQKTRRDVSSAVTVGIESGKILGRKIQKESRTSTES